VQEVEGKVVVEVEVENRKSGVRDNKIL